MPPVRGITYTHASKRQQSKWRAACRGGQLLAPMAQPDGALIKRWRRRRGPPAQQRIKPKDIKESMVRGYAKQRRPFARADRRFARLIVILTSFDIN
jgi:hypothetical protein